MLNNLVLVGRVATKPEVRTFEDGSRVADFTLAVDRPFKSIGGEKPDTDFFKITVWQAYADVVYTYCGVGSVIGVKGRIASRKIEIGERRVNTVDIIGERIAFIHTVRPNDNSSREEVQEITEAQINDQVASDQTETKKK